VKAPHWLAACLLFAMSASACARNFTPMRFAASTTFSAPTRSSSGTKKVLIDLPKPVHML
jgi:hypothetical protein